MHKIRRKREERRIKEKLKEGRKEERDGRKID